MREHTYKLTRTTVVYLELCTVRPKATWDEAPDVVELRLPDHAIQEILNQRAHGPTSGRFNTSEHELCIVRVCKQAGK